MTGAGNSATTGQQILHATSLVCCDQGVLILGAAGSGKSGLALALMAHGASLIADDRTILTVLDEQLVASAPGEIAGMIEARGIGLLNAAIQGPHPLHLAIDLDQIETRRLPPPRQIRIQGRVLPLLHKVDNGYFPVAILHYLKAGISKGDR
jgi:HPr kinase/phosphorylase